MIRAPGMPSRSSHGAEGARAAGTVGPVTTREKLHLLVDDLSDAEVEAALTRLVREGEAVERWAEAEDGPAVGDTWALANARDAIREDPW